MDITMRYERRRAILTRKELVRATNKYEDFSYECRVLLCCCTEELGPVFIVEFNDGSVEAVPISQVRFIKEDDEC